MPYSRCAYSKAVVFSSLAPEALIILVLVAQGRVLTHVIMILDIFLIFSCSANSLFLKIMCVFES